MNTPYPMPLILAHPTEPANDPAFHIDMPPDSDMPHIRSELLNIDASVPDDDEEAGWADQEAGHPNLLDSYLEFASRLASSVGGGETSMTKFKASNGVTLCKLAGSVSELVMPEFTDPQLKALTTKHTPPMSWGLRYFFMAPVDGIANGWTVAGQTPAGVQDCMCWFPQ
mmetsp:Transcript_37422/g.90351  ORF Transcript_37422/g.90351 Transcript_37422/m.90351 type:complete len:169 (+) Transcript_37422:26-532(+)